MARGGGLTYFETPQIIEWHVGIFATQHIHHSTSQTSGVFAPRAWKDIIMTVLLLLALALTLLLMVVMVICVNCPASHQCHHATDDHTQSNQNYNTHMHTQTHARQQMDGQVVVIGGQSVSGRTGPPGICQVGQLIRRTSGPPRQMLKEGVEWRREPRGPLPPDKLFVQGVPSS